MSFDDIGCVITCINECGEQATPALVYAIARIINVKVTFEEVVNAMRFFKVNVD
jgi:acetaldehyde dehydrogenase (acetylating)